MNIYTMAYALACIYRQNIIVEAAMNNNFINRHSVAGRILGL